MRKAKIKTKNEPGMRQRSLAILTATHLLNIWWWFKNYLWLWVFFSSFHFAFICLFALLLTSEFSPPAAVPFSKLKFREICTFDRLQMESSIISHLYHHELFSIVYNRYLLFACLLVCWYFHLKVTARGSWLIVYPVEIIEYIGLSKDQDSL